jgi:hypothetical protein
LLTETLTVFASAKLAVRSALQSGECGLDGGISAMEGNSLSPSGFTTLRAFFLPFPAGTPSVRPDADALGEATMNEDNRVRLPERL